MGEEDGLSQRVLNDLYGGPGFLVVVRSASCLSFSFFLCVAGRVYLEAKSYDDEQAWSLSINHSILSGWSLTREGGG
jgi:hypothetical protein